MQRIDYDQLAADYAASRSVHPGILACLLQSVADRNVRRILEVGSGTGNYIGALAAVSGCECWGVEPSSEMLAVAAARWPGVTWRQSSAEALQCDGGVFDLVFSVDVVHHMQSIDHYFTEAHRVLAPGGWICTATDSEEIVATRRPLATYWPETVAAELRRYPKIAQLELAMRRAGFDNLVQETVEHTYTLSDPEPYRRRAYSALWLIPEAAWREGLERLQADMAAGPVEGVARYLMLWGERG